MDQSNSLPPGYTRTSQTVRLTLAATGTTNDIQHVNLPGSKFYIVDASSDAFLRIKTDKTAEERFQVGTGKDLDKTGQGFYQFLEIANPNAFPITLYLFVGFGEYIDKRTTIVGNRLSSILPTVEPDTQIIAVVGAINSIAASTAIALPGVAAGLQIRRKAVIVSNDDPATLLYVETPTGDRVCVVQPKTEVILPISMACRVRNPSAAIVSATVSEIWWLAPVFV